MSDFCPCCNYPHEGELFPLFCDTADLAELGEGFPLYFNLLKWVAFLMIVSFSIAGSFCIYRNYNANNVKDSALQSNWIVKGSLANYGDNLTPTIAEPSLHVAAILVILFLHNFIVIKHEKMEAELDKNAITPSDYTIVVSKVPTEGFNKEELRRFFETQSRMVSSRQDGKECKVSKVNLVFSISEYIQESVRLSKLKERLAEIHLLLSQKREPTKTVYCCFKGPVETVEEYEQLIKDQKRALLNMERSVQERFTGICFVTFREDEDSKSAKRVLGKPKATKGWKQCFLAFCPCCRETNARRYKGKLLEVRRAPDPSDILWENLGVSPCKVAFRRIVTAIATAIVLCIGAAVIYFSSSMKVRTIQGLISDAYKEIHNPSIGQTIGFNIMSFLPSIIVVIMNVIITATIWKFERVSLYQTISDLQAAVTRNLTFAMFINTALIAIPIHLGDWYGSSGLVPEIYNIMISNAVVAPIISLISPMAIWKWVQRKRALKQGNLCMLTQQEANTLFEGVPVIMPNLCAGVMKTYLLSVMYAPVLPVGLIIGCIAVAIQYWVNKVMLLRRHCRPVRLSDELDDVMLKFIPVGCAAYAGATFYFYWDLDTMAFIPGIVACSIVFIYLLTPFQRVLKICMRRQMQPQTILSLSETPKTYEESAVDFFTDYDRVNPATSTEGNAWWVELIARKQGSEAAQIASTLVGQSGSMKTYAKGLAPVAKNYKTQKSSMQPSAMPLELNQSVNSPQVPLDKRDPPGVNLSSAQQRYRSELYRKGASSRGGLTRALRSRKK